MLNPETLAQTSDELVRAARKMCPDMELHELGALFLSIGCFVSASAIPELWVRLRSTAELSQELLSQDILKAKLKT